MKTITIHYQNKTFLAQEGQTLLAAEIAAQLRPDAPCGGRGTCGKCRVLVDGVEELACQYILRHDVRIELPESHEDVFLLDGIPADAECSGTDRYVIAFDVGTTTLIAYLLDGKKGTLLAQAGCLNPQAQYGADVISRVQYALDGGAEELSACLLAALGRLTHETAGQAGICARDITCAAIAGNTAMHHLLLSIDTKPLITPPYMPRNPEALELPARALLPIAEKGTVRVLPLIAGFVGGDTVACMISTRFDRLEKPALLIDIGTNGEMVLTDGRRRVACSTAAGPAFEGAKIQCGMRGAAGAIDHVFLEDWEVRWHVLGETEACGICGSGLLDLVAVLREAGIIHESGLLNCGKDYRIGETNVFLTQKDIREVQLAKAAIRAGIELMAEKLDLPIQEIDTVYLAGAFGNYMRAGSACAIGMIPPCLLEKVQSIGNAAGEGAKRCALSWEAFEYSKRIAAQTEFLELASLPQFQDRFVDSLHLSEE